MLMSASSTYNVETIVSTLISHMPAPSSHNKSYGHQVTHTCTRRTFLTFTVRYNARNKYYLKFLISLSMLNSQLYSQIKAR